MKENVERLLYRYPELDNEIKKVSEMSFAFFVDDNDETQVRYT